MISIVLRLFMARPFLLLMSCSVCSKDPRYLHFFQLDSLFFVEMVFFCIGCIDVEPFIFKHLPDYPFYFVDLVLI